VAFRFRNEILPQHRTFDPALDECFDVEAERWTLQSECSTNGQKSLF
jgi:hypothetical protein